jgi:hypothetical protein
MHRINIWSSPRNISTAFMYSFAQREDATVFDEPLYAHYLTKTNSTAEHPGTTEILDSQENSGKEVVKDLILGNHSTDVVLFKQMTHHLIHLNEDFLFKTQNILLIRDPQRIASYAKVIANPQMHDIGIQKQYELFKQLEKGGNVAAVVDARQLLLNPRKVLEILCQRLDIPFDEKMLTWKAGARPEDGVWAKYWYTNVHQSTGFQPYVEKTVTLPKKLALLAKDCQHYYDFLFSYAIKSY